MRPPVDGLPVCQPHWAPVPRLLPGLYRGRGSFEVGSADHLIGHEGQSIFTYRESAYSIAAVEFGHSKTNFVIGCFELAF